MLDSNSNSEDQKTLLILRLWTFKEALVKLLGRGSSIDFGRLSFTLSSPGSGPVKVDVLGEQGGLRDEVEGVKFWEGRMGGVGVVVAYRQEGEGEGGVEVTEVEVTNVIEGARRTVERLLLATG